MRRGFEIMRQGIQPKKLIKDDKSFREYWSKIYYLVRKYNETGQLKKITYLSHKGTKLGK